MLPLLLIGQIFLSFLLHLENGGEEHGTDATPNLGGDVVFENGYGGEENGTDLTWNVGEGTSFTVVAMIGAERGSLRFVPVAI